MGKYDIIYAHYGSDRRFDIPFIRTRALKHNMEGLIPKRNQLFIMDTYPISRNKLKLHSNRLDSIGEHLGCKTGKTRLSPNMWQRAAIGDKKALDYIVDHNKKDVQLLEEIHKRIGVFDSTPLKSI
jgi:uncharacterized protein YprB with RNaseH-like and TPR domain